MTLPSAHSTTTTLRTVSVASEPATATLLSQNQLGFTGGATLRRVGVSPAQFSSVQYVNGSMDGTALHGNVRYLMPVNMQRASESYVVVNQAPQMLTPVYLQNVQNVQNMARVSVSSMDETDSIQQNINGQASVFSTPSSPIKSPEPPEPVESISTSSSVQEVVNFDVKTDFEFEPLEKLDTRFFGELLAEVYRKNCDIHTCISEHVSKIRGRKHLDLDYKKEDIEHLIPKGVSELTKQQIRYLLQTRMTADMTMRMLLSTFSSLREDLVHLQDDLRRLESEKEQLERDLSFKAEQSLQYDRLLESVRENNRQLQISLKESTSAQRKMETQLMNTRSTDSSRDFRIKDLEGSKRALEQENELLRKKLEGQCSNATLQTKTQDLSRHYEQLLKELREEKDKELNNMRSQLVKIQTEYTTDRSSDKSLQLRITELLTTLEQRESTIRRQEEEIRKLQQERTSSSDSLTQTVITKKYQTQYPILGLLSDDYQYTPPPVRESKTIVIKRTGEMTKKGYTT
ncbi:protein POF1B isoform X2 [Tachysurus fulvidraco]|uniref:protein POF1B isoform X2 n=1 Tax=Tachysurus fulvidraco TaxID=1234273 RepID=UPI000F4E1767|nr:protein POF1B isoform X2 [Tachysurus fulvidraco]